MGPLVTDKVGLVDRTLGMIILGKDFGILHLCTLRINTYHAGNGISDFNLTRMLFWVLLRDALRQLNLLARSIIRISFLGPSKQ